MSATAAVLAFALAASGPAFDHEHALWTRALSAHVRDGFVDYAAWKDDRADLTAYLATLEGVTAEQYRRFDLAQKRAFWINAYNAYTVKLILDHHPVAGIRKIGRLWQSPFRLEFIPLEKLRGGKISLDVIEHDILRRELFDARIHAAIVCAARSCPVLRSRAYTAARLDAALDAAMRAFLADPTRNRWNAETGRLELSSIFKWFREDFEKAEGSLAAWVRRYGPCELAAKLPAGDDFPVAFLDYDWSLNGR